MDRRKKEKEYTVCSMQKREGSGVGGWKRGGEGIVLDRVAAMKISYLEKGRHPGYSMPG
jgi:hypothetical protein